MSNIPGLSLLPVDNEDENAIEIHSFIGKAAVPESHKHGNCRKIAEFLKVSDLSKGKFFNMYLCRDLKAEEKETLHTKKTKIPHDFENDSNDTEIEEKDKQYRFLKKFKVPSGFKNGMPRELLREFSILNCLNHVNIIKSRGPVAGNSFDNNYLLMDYCRFSLKDIMGKKFATSDESVVKCIINQLFQGLRYLHSSLIVHRAVSSENIVFNNEGILKLTDFYFSCFDDLDLRTPVKSEKRYQAPELLLFSDKKAYNSKVDMWSTGCVLAEFGLKKPLFEGVSDRDVLDSIFKVLGTPDDTVWPGFQELFASLYHGERVITDPMPYRVLKDYITGASTPCFEIIDNLLLYFAEYRFTAKKCLELNYFREQPTACSTEHLATILQASIETPVEPTT